jgi:hypothetical protein
MKNKIQIQNDYELIWKKIDEQKKLQKELLSNYPKYDHIVTLNWYLCVFVEKVRKFKAKEVELKQGYKEFKINSFQISSHYIELSSVLVSIINMQMMMKDYFYQFSKLVAGDDQNIKKSFDDIIDNWKNLPCTKISKVLRDKVQHGSILSPNLKIDVQTSNHPSGESASLFIFDEKIFDKVKTELGANGEAFYKAVFPKDHPNFGQLIVHNSKEMIDCGINLFKEFQKKFPCIINERVQIIISIKNIDDWFEKHGLLPASPTLPSDFDICYFEEFSKSIL